MFKVLENGCIKPSKGSVRIDQIIKSSSYKI